MEQALNQTAEQPVAVSDIPEGTTIFDLAEDFNFCPSGSVQANSENSRKRPSFRIACSWPGLSTGEGGIWDSSCASGAGSGAAPAWRSLLLAEKSC